MPELPDVEIFKRRLDSQGLGKPVKAIHVRDQRLLKGVSASTLRRHLKDHALISSRRHGKLLFAGIEGDPCNVLLHFGMTGGLAGYGREAPAPAHSAVVLDFADGTHLAYYNQRTFGRVDLVEDVDAYLKETRQGPDPLGAGFDLARFRDALRGRGGTIKGTLMNQSVLAGLGNVYSDEILLRAGVHPESETGALDGEAVEALCHAMREVIDTAIEARADPHAMPRTFLLPHRGQGAGCPRCGEPVKKRRVAGRSAYFCSHCQRRYR